MICKLCEKPIVWNASIYVEVSGWAMRRRAGGLNALRVRRETGAVAHTECVDKLNARIDPKDQETLL